MRHYLPSSTTTMSFHNNLHMGRHASNKNIYHLLTHVFLCLLHGFDQFLFVPWQGLILDNLSQSSTIFHMLSVNSSRMNLQAILGFLCDELVSNTLL